MSDGPFAILLDLLYPYGNINAKACQSSSPADALAKLASYDKAWITYLFLLR